MSLSWAIYFIYIQFPPQRYNNFLKHANFCIKFYSKCAFLALFALNFIHITQIFIRLASKKSLSLSGKTQFQAQFNPRSYDCHNSSSVFWVFLTLIEAIVFDPFSSIFDRRRCRHLAVTLRVEVVSRSSGRLAHKRTNKQLHSWPCRPGWQREVGKRCFL